MQRRRRSAPHTFEENIAAEKAELEAQIAKLKAWSSDGCAPQEDPATRYRISFERLAFVSGTAAP